MIQVALIIGVLLCLLCPGLPAVQPQVTTAGFCDLARDPGLYAGRVVRTEAILLESHKPRVDGGEPILYDPACGGKDVLVLANWDQFSPAEDRALRELDNIRAKADRRGNSRASVTVVGRFESGGRYGHLDWAGAQLVIHAVERARRVPAAVRWPKRHD